MVSSIQFGSKSIEFSVIYQNRKTLGIMVNPDQTVTVNAPDQTELSLIQEKVHKRAAWILKQQDLFQSFEPRRTPRQYVGGETHLYLGRQYKLKLELSDTKSVKLLRGILYVYTPDKQDKEAVQKQLDNWYRTKAIEKITLFFDECWIKFNTYDLPKPTLVIQKMDKRWGSCTPKNKIILNSELIKAPKVCIEYVITHEFCHLLQPNHNKTFFKLLQKVEPQWKVWKEKLEMVMA
jgi:predicted metal-dependent hydrolase